MADPKSLLGDTQTVSVKAEDLRANVPTTDSYFMLTVIEGRDFGYSTQIKKDEIKIGRKDSKDNKEVEIQLDDERVSKEHTKIIKRQLINLKIVQIYVVDLDSKNGTLLNGTQLASLEEVELEDGDKIQIGDTVLKLEIKDHLDTSYHEKLYNQVTKDPLTDIWNYNYAQQEMDKLISISTRYKVPFSLALIEVDFFQTLNETYGRTVGDVLLKNIAKTASNQIANTNVLARWSGTQFITLMPETDLKGANSVIEKIRQAIEKFDFSSYGCTQRVTVSAGITEFPICGKNKQELVKQADEALYKAKQGGRNAISLTEVKAKEAKAPQRKKILKYIAGVILLVVLVSTIAYIYPRLITPTKTIYSGLIEAQETLVGSQQGGYIQEVNVEEGEMVKKGQLLARINASDLMGQRALYEAKLEQAQAQLTKMVNGNRPEEIAQAQAEAKEALASLEAVKTGPRPQEIAQAEADLGVAVSDLANLEKTFNRANEVFENGLTSKQSRDDAEAQVITAKQKVESLKQKLSLIQAGSRLEDIKIAEQKYQTSLAKVHLLEIGSRSEDIADAKGKLKEAQSQLTQVNFQILDTEVKAPCNSRVEAISIRPGNIVAANKSIVKLLELDQIWVRIYVPEPDLGKVKVNQKAVITIDSFPNRKFAGYVEQISSQGEFLPRNVQTRKERDYQVFGVKVHIDNKTGELKSGMAADIYLE